MAARHNIDDHVQFLVTDPSWDSRGLVVVANFTSLKGATTDHLCVVNAGEHPLISRPSVVVFNRAGIVRVDDLVNAERIREISRRAPLSEDLYEKILDAFAVSRNVQIRTKKMLEDQELI